MSEYIGRRIVPVHGGVWNGSKSYEELTIVLHEDSGDSYISRRSVPAGTAITDENYWMLHSLYSQQIADAEKDLADAVEDVKARIAASEEAVDQRASAAETVSNENRDELNTRMDQMETRLDANVSASTDSDADYAAEVVDARVDYLGKTWGSLGAMSRGLSERITEKVRSSYDIRRNAIPGCKTDFMATENLAYGEIRKKYKLSGSLAGDMKLISSQDYYMMFVDIEPSTSYTFFRQENVALENGYYNIKIATFLETKEELLDTMERGVNVAVDGDVLKGCTAASGTCQYCYQFTTGENDKCVVIQLAEDIEPDYVELLKGTYSEKQYSSYMEGLYNSFSVQGVKAEGCDFWQPSCENLYTGELDYDKYYLSTDSANVVTDSTNNFIAVIPIDPDTQYAIAVSGLSFVLTNGTYYFKYATVSALPDDPADLVFDSLHKTIYTNKTCSLVSGDNDHYLLVCPFSRAYRTENNATLLVIVGDESALPSDVSDGNWRYSPKGVYVYSKDEVYNKSETYSRDETYPKENLYTKDELYTEDEVDECLMLSVSKTASALTITQGKSVYTVKRQISSSINLDTWRVYSGQINGNIVWNGTDIEGPIKQVGADDFIGGCHGDEIYQSVRILVDGTEISEDAVLEETKAHVVTLFVSSDVYFCNDTQNIAFTRYKKLEFRGRKLVVSNKWIYVGEDEFSVSRYTGCGLYSIYKDLLTGYSVDTECRLITDEGTGKSTDVESVSFYGKDFTATIRVLSGKGDYYCVNVTDFSSESRPRFKAYLDCINSSMGAYTMNTGDTLSASFEIEII